MDLCGPLKNEVHRPQTPCFVVFATLCGRVDLGGSPALYIGIYRETVFSICVGEVNKVHRSTNYTPNPCFIDSSPCGPWVWTSFLRSTGPRFPSGSHPSRITSSPCCSGRFPLPYMAAGNDASSSLSPRLADKPICKGALCAAAWWRHGTYRAIAQLVRCREAPVHPTECRRSIPCVSTNLFGVAVSRNLAGL